MSENILIAMTAFSVGIMVGNFLGDAATLKDCATTSSAKMLSGGTITCEVVKEKK